MYTPTTASVIMPLPGVDAALHTFVGLSWHILLPYTLFGAVLMVYSQSKLMSGQRAFERDNLLDDVREADR